MTVSVIFAACMELLEDFSHSPQPEIMWPGIQSEPPEDGFWIEPKLFPGEPVDRIWDDEACAETRGFFQMLLYWRVRPIDLGMVAPLALADALIAHFPKGTALGPVRVRKKPYQSPPNDNDPSKPYIQITVPYLGSM